LVITASGHRFSAALRSSPKSSSVIFTFTCTVRFMLGVSRICGCGTTILEKAMPPLRDIALLILDTGLRVREPLGLPRCHAHLRPVNEVRSAYIHVADGKSRYARRNAPLTDRARAVLERRALILGSPYVFPSATGRPYLVQSIDRIRQGACAVLRLPHDFVVYSLRHTYGPLG
jgi:integrase